MGIQRATLKIATIPPVDFMTTSVHNPQTPIERLMEAMLESSPDAMLVVGPRGRIRAANEAAAALFGYDHDDLVGNEVERLLPASLRERHRMHRAAYAAQPTRRRMGEGLDLVALRRDGTLVPVDISLNSLEFEGERFTIAAVRDNTGALEKQRELSRAVDTAETEQAKLQALLEALHVGVWILDEGGAIVYGNRAAQEIWQGVRYVPLERYGEYKAWWYDTREPIVAEAWAGARAVRHGEVSLDELIRIQCFDGTFKVILNSAMPYHDSEGALLGAIIVNHDVTLFLEAEEQLRVYNRELERSNRDLDDFATMVAHDLREPLRTVMGYCGLLSRRLRGRLDAEEEALIGTAMAAVKRADRMVRGLVEVAKVGARAKVPARASLADLVRAALANLATVVQEHGVKVSCGPLPDVLVDETQVVQVFQNLFANAIRYRSSRRPEIQVSAVKRDGRWRVSVRDNGKGIEPAAQARLFRMFERGPDAPDDSSGVGLALCRRIVERHGGEIGVDSEPGVGSTFWFSLPGVPELEGAKRVD